MTLGLRLCVFAAAIACTTALLPSVPSASAASGGITGVLEQGLGDAAPDAMKETETNLSKVIGNIIGSLMSFIGALLFVYLLYGGFTYMTAGGDEKKVKTALDIIKNCVIGIVIIVMAYSISTFIIEQVGEATTPASGGAATTPAK